jgi:hypothetical protein
VLVPLRLDVGEQPWPIASAAAVVSLNMIHIAPWAAGMALIRGAAAVLEPGAMLPSTGRFAAEPGTRRRATRPLTGSCARRIRPGACAIWRRLRATPRRTVSARRSPRYAGQQSIRRAAQARAATTYRLTEWAADAGLTGNLRPPPGEALGAGRGL